MAQSSTATAALSNALPTRLLTGVLLLALLAFAGNSHALRVRTEDGLVAVNDGGTSGYAATVDARIVGANGGTGRAQYQCPVGGLSGVRFPDQPVILVTLRQESYSLGAFLRNYVRH